MQSIQALRQTLDRWLYPDLSKVAPHHRERAMQRARSEAFDFLEICGLAAAIAAVTYFTRYALKAPSVSDRLSAAIANFIVAIPQLVLFAGPLLVRRNRRGLRAFLDELNPPKT
ncbi:MAG TPA: hypothetical protein PK264_14585 [Hyphomicrobiaceae bacterium]|nr:hypothetical protein [Hyphomicrobiaceae bacterium]